MGRMRPLADRPQTVERRNAQRRRKITIGTAAVEDSSSFTFKSAASLRASWNSDAISLLRSMGGRFRPPLISSVHRLSKGFSERNFLSITAASRKRGILMSMCARASAAVTFERVPPAMTPGFTVIPLSRIGERGDHPDLSRHFQNRAGPLFEVDARVGRDAADGHRIVANPLRAVLT